MIETQFSTPALPESVETAQTIALGLRDVFERAYDKLTVADRDRKMIGAAIATFTYLASVLGEHGDLISKDKTLSARLGDIVDAYDYWNGLDIESEFSILEAFDLYRYARKTVELMVKDIALHQSLVGRILSAINI